MIILDIETSGLSPLKNGVLSIGAVHFKSGSEFYGECQLEEGREASLQALAVNGFSEQEIRDHRKDNSHQLLAKFIYWASQFADGKILGGHNVGHFDILFTEEVFGRFFDGKFPFSYRTVDLHSIAYAKFGESLSHEQICVKLGLEPEPKPHNALEGAKSEAAALRILLQ